MAETFLADITENVLSKIVSLAQDEISSAWNLKPELKKLQNTLSTIKAVLRDADEQQAKNHEVKDWLQKLRDVVYDADDLLDDFGTLSLLRKLRSCSGILTKVRKLFTRPDGLIYRFKITHKIREIRGRLNQIAEDRRNFHFKENYYVNPVENGKLREQTHSFVRPSDIIGRDSDKESIVGMLMKSCDEEDTESVSFLPIVGLGGLGKTTLVKLVYNDDRVVQNFDTRLWVSVSEDFSLSKVIEKILRSATGKSFGHLDMDQLQEHLNGVLCSGRYLLVLDDVWNEDQHKWKNLRELLMSGCDGSRVIVTTRSIKVATITGTTTAYNLSGLSDHDCFDLFLKCAFREQEYRPRNLVEIGKEIVQKCGGVPLAVKTLGSMLYCKTDEQEWLHIRENEIWKIEQKETDILPILKLSYDQMPYHLRQCFAYCCMFPKGEEIPREVFINLWVAQGFIQSPDGDQELENLGNQYFNELLSRFCFQDVVEAFDGEILACKIHNLVHDLAQSVAGAECLNVKSGDPEIPESVHHLVFHADNLSREEFPQPLLNLKNLRYFAYSFRVGTVSKTFVKKTLLNFRRLRVLMLQNLELKELPSSIGFLKQLRYLNLSNNCNIKSLPECISKLVNLQTLNLINCEQLKELPRNFGQQLMSLKTLYLTSQEVSLQKRSSVSLGFLQFLLLYKCSCRKFPAEIWQHMKKLRVLRIYECSSLTCLPAGIRHLAKLEKLWIWNCEELDLSVGEGMEGLESLQSLLLMGLPKLVSLPAGLKDIDAMKLKYLRVAGCPELTALPDWLQNCTLLQRLYIEDCPELSYLPEQIRSSSNAKVRIIDCPLLNG
ncbi:PREDICTED: putative disease resistance protein RGA3 [Ipomoea nil]|uniref:putative disease resistance protein RGA3 n=1 Tax=Ipomoea nil TaxID=35883 RepID=UPI0009010B3E|nr:PREDICTED: putative disease resistance protein RGA3 [Ipomoea nil]